MKNDNDRKETPSIEERLARLVPTPQDALAEKIMAVLDDATLQTVSKSQRKSHRQPIPVHSPLLAGMLGIVLGAAAMFLLMTVAFPPKAEVREIVREVVVDAPTAVVHATEPNSTKNESIANVPPSVEVEIFVESPRRNATSLFPLFFGSNAMTPRHQVSFVSLDLDKIIDEAAMRQSTLAAAYPRHAIQKPLPVLYHAEYREMLHEALNSL